ncbi:DUF2569 domain-containing protein [Rouxiella badensis]|jgi:hypothetical protein|uniref:DUF2569 domain-containing protein n=1 Tax=Rouxiella badensis TaxID=1646377 RepID=A0A1X0WGZ5_9GAMM|nr:DUF2569 domain-containing protein [Rouxiella badensis]MCC3701936.1 DUF2569 domain-containing protein [Rouxiella badensis]MCC3718094.1 DUF2569 domain-containing protein [Rouxiella badensis]MCC3727138.1 DUF2569 domain-containing protein [Rouxiella badensis]MCC3731578.1 DUF2569 domain-containing protein [Rouxiella badensis]MCC3738513.1 DUF2569 domain-containing protein [Rouxiella badensis]
MSLNSGYQRIGGWLLAPMAYLIVNLMSVVLMLLLYSMAVFEPESRKYLITHSQAFTLQWYFSVVTTLAMGAFTLSVLWSFCRRMKSLPRLYILWLLFTVLLAIKTFAFSPISDNLAVRNLLIPLLAAALLVPYFKRSRRVKETFTQ